MSTQQGEYYLSDRAASSSDDEEHSVMMTFEWDNGYVFSVERKINPTWARDINHQNQNIDWSGPRGDVDQNMNGWHRDAAGKGFGDQDLDQTSSMSVLYIALATQKSEQFQLPGF